MRTIESTIQYLLDNNISENKIQENRERIENIFNSFHPKLKDDLAYEKILKYLNRPSIIDKMHTLANAVFSYSGNNMQNVPNEVQAQRLSICHSCDMYNPNNKTCNTCGCFLQIKTSWATEKCPLDKWAAEIEQIQHLPVAQSTPSGDCGCNKK